MTLFKLLVKTSRGSYFKKGEEYGVIQSVLKSAGFQLTKFSTVTDEDEYKDLEYWTNKIHAYYDEFRRFPYGHDLGFDHKHSTYLWVELLDAAGSHRARGGL